MSLTHIFASGSKLPIARLVYLVPDASDVARMGGVSNNVYSTLTAAYAAADALQISLGGTNVVGIRIIGRALTPSSITLTADWNPRVALIGDGSDYSQIGTITLTNAAGNGFNFGTSIANVIIYGVRLGANGINTSATGATGNAGSIYINSISSFLGRLQALVTNSLNTTGNTGDILVRDFYGATVISTVSNNQSFVSATGAIGSTYIEAKGRISIGGMENVGADFPGSTNGPLTLINADVTSVNKYTDGIAFFKNCELGQISMVLPTSGNILMEDTDINSLFNFAGSGAGSILSIKNSKIGLNPFGLPLGNPNFISGFELVDLWNCYINNDYDLTDPLEYSLHLDVNVNILFKDCVINNISNYAAQTGTAAGVILIDNSTLLTCKLIHCSVMGGVLALDAPGPVTVDTFSTYLQQPNGVNITLNPL